MAQSTAISTGRHLWFPEELQPGDEGSLHDFFREVRGAAAERIILRWPWQSVENPGGPCTHLVVRKGGRFLGSATALPVGLSVSGVLLKACWL
ncbi:MAG: hypothetical protein JW937_09730, partial [Candidatus Omnitrophica bacterium]|nr:hypothetical protein [Candidatus Omnitrophota bacterium]